MRIYEATILRIEELCKDRDITVNRLATISGITQSTLGNIVNKKNKNIMLGTIKKVCDGLDIGIIDFFDCDLFKNLEQEII